MEHRALSRSSGNGPSRISECDGAGSSGCSCARAATQRTRAAGMMGGWFVRSLDAPVKPRFKMKAPAKIVPRESPALADAAAQFFAIQNQVRVFLRKYADIDLAGVRFPNPFIRGVRFSLATGLHVIAAHDRRHVWQAWNVDRRSVA